MPVRSIKAARHIVQHFVESASSSTSSYSYPLTPITGPHMFKATTLRNWSKEAFEPAETKADAVELRHDSENGLHAIALSPPSAKTVDLFFLL
ncbi:hypothetical protein JCM8547_005852 [Rhodosporidiobolus lusitaniae]